MVWMVHQTHATSEKPRSAPRVCIGQGYSFSADERMRYSPQCLVLQAELGRAVVLLKDCNSGDCQVPMQETDFQLMRRVMQRIVDDQMVHYVQVPAVQILLGN